MEIFKECKNCNYKGNIENNKCPVCGAKIKKSFGELGWIFFGFILFLFFLALIITSLLKSPKPIDKKWEKELNNKGLAKSKKEKQWNVIDYSKILGKKRTDIEMIIGQNYKTEKDRDAYAYLKGISPLIESYEARPKVIWCDYQIKGHIVSIAYYDNNWNLYKSSEEKFYRDRAYYIEISFKKSHSKEYLLKAIGFNDLNNFFKKHPGRQSIGNSWVWNSDFGEIGSLIENYPYGFGSWNRTSAIIGPNGSNISIIIKGDINKLKKHEH